MSANVIDLKLYRNTRRRSWLRKNEERIHRVIRNCLGNNVQLDFHSLVDAYQAQRRFGMDESWDYLDLRELISDVLDHSEVVDEIIRELRSHSWFDPRHVSRQKILELCLSVFILEAG